MDNASSTYRVNHCSKCPGDTEYCCVSCECGLCPQCKENHVKDLKTIDHIVVAHREKIKYTKTKTKCANDPRIVHKENLLPCEHPLCYYCPEYEKHITLDKQNSETVLKRKRLQNGGIIHTIRSDALFYRPPLIPEIEADFENCRREFLLHQSEVLTRARKLKHLTNYVLYDLLNNVFCDFNFKHRCLKQKIEMSRHIVSIQRFVEIYEQSEFKFSALQFLLFVKKTLQQMHLTLHTSQLFMTESLNKEDVMESLSAIKIKEKGNRLRVGNEYRLKLMSAPQFHQSFTVGDLENCLHISCLASDLAYISDDNHYLSLTNTKGDFLNREGICFDIITMDYGTHTVNSDSELIYISKLYPLSEYMLPLAIKKLSKDQEQKILLICRNTTDSEWKPRCVYWSPSTGDLLVGMWEYKTKTGKVTRYNQSGQLTQTIQDDNTGQGLYSQPNYLTENNNGDVVVSDCLEYSHGTVVVTERGGRHRFSYKGPSSGSELDPRGICTDALSHILVCDDTSKTVHIIDKDGQFLSHLLVRPSGITSPCGLSYDVNTHRLWVGSRYNNTVVIYRYITRLDPRTATADVILDTETEEQQHRNQKTEETNQENRCLLKLTVPPELFRFITVKDVNRCDHISCVTSDRVWVSDNRKTLVSSGFNSHRVWDLRGNLYGLHTVNSESELIYINENYNINKLSKDMKTTTTFIKRPDSSWRPRCVYWSPSTGDLLVGMYRVEPREKGDTDNTDATDDVEFSRTSKVVRYNHSGELTQTIKHDNTGRELYRKPHYIAENNNGDVVVSDDDAVVVTGRGGSYRFSYTGRPSGSELDPRGICTDPLSRILVCDNASKTVHMIDKDGQFLSHLLTELQEIGEPRSLSYDVKTHLLWVGSGDKKVRVYRYITNQDAPTDTRVQFPDDEAMTRSTPAV